MARRTPLIAVLAVLAIGGVALSPVSAAGVLDTISGIDRAKGVAITADYVYVTSNNEVPGDDGVTVIDADTRAVVTTLTVGDAPGNIVINPSGTKAYVINTYSDNVSVITLATNTVTNTIQVGNYPVGIVFTPDGATAYVSNYGAGSVSRIDTTTEVATTIALSSGVFPGFPQGLAMSPDGGELYIADTNSDVVGVYTVATNSYQADTFVTGNYPHVVKVSTDGTRLYVVNNGDPTDGTISVYNRTTRALIETIQVGAGYPDDLLVTAEALYVSIAGSPSGLVKIDQTSLDIVSRVPLLSARGIGRSADGTLWVAQIDAGSVALIGTEVDRIAGANRVEVAINVSQAAFPSGADTVFIATGYNYPDALSAGPTAAMYDAPLLLTQTAALPASVATEIGRLGATKAVIVGGPNSVAPAVETQLDALLGAANVDRLEGSNRYVASRNIVSYGFVEDGVETNLDALFVATGRNFPDALSAGAVGAGAEIPLLLVDGVAATLDAATLAFIEELSPGVIYVAGGPNSVSNSLVTQLNGIAPTTRFSGANRYEASVNINKGLISEADHAFIATGLNYPDALAGSALAGQLEAPLYVSQTNCVPAGVLNELDRLAIGQVTLLGGPVSLTVNVENLVRCAT